MQTHAQIAKPQFEAQLANQREYKTADVVRQLPEFETSHFLSQYSNIYVIVFKDTSRLYFDTTSRFVSTKLIS